MAEDGVPEGSDTAPAAAAAAEEVPFDAYWRLRIV